MTMAASGERLFPANPPDPRPLISHGLPFPAACIHHARNTFHASRIYVVVSASISKTKDFLSLRSILGDNVVGIRRGIRPHTPWEDILPLAQELDTVHPDLIITLGAGSITDAAKIASFACSNSVSSREDLEALARHSVHRPNAPTLKACHTPILHVPTSLSGAEYTSGATATDLRNHKKSSFKHDSLTGSLVALDPQLCISTPSRVWLSTGVRAIDHCIEGICSAGLGATDQKRKLLDHGLVLLLPNLLATMKDAGDLRARTQTMLALHPCLQAIEMGLGASHGIGRQLGPWGVGHGETSCVMLPAVLRFNYQHGGEEIRSLQERVRNIFWDEPTVMEALLGQGLTREASDASDTVGAFISVLGLPRSLADVGVTRASFDQLADNSLEDSFTRSNPVPLTKENILELLDMVAGD